MDEVTDMAADSGKNLVTKRLTAAKDAWASFNLKSCPRCKGDLYLDFEDQIIFAKCLQCSRNFEVVSSWGLWEFLRGKLTGQPAA